MAAVLSVARPLRTSGGALQARGRVHRVADVLVDLHAVAQDDRVEAPPETVHQQRDVLVIERRREGRELGDVGEQHRDQLAPIGRLGLSLQHRQPLAQRREGRIHDRVAQRAVLRLQCGDAVQQPVDIPGRQLLRIMR
jgi:hypothetical protein